MDIDNIFKSDKKDVMLTLRISEKEKRFIDKNNISPSALFRECLNDLEESTVFNKKIQLKKAWKESCKKGDERFSVCVNCGKIYLGKAANLEKNIRVCKTCAEKK